MAVDDSRLGDDEYSFAMNVRNRFGELTPIKRPLTISTGFTANQRFQGIYTVGDFILLFQSGNAKFKHRLSSTWVTLWDGSTRSSLQMSANVDFMYVQAVPGSTMNMERKATSATGAEDISLTYNSTAWVKTSAGIVVQDGENIPNLIIFSSSNQTAVIDARKCTAYTDWDVTTREYVPIGKQMMFFGGKLYVIGADASGNFTQIYHSVTGRPLDFVVAINDSGAQIDADEEANGGAGVVSYSVSYESVTCMRPLNTNSFFISTRTSS